MLGWAGTGRYLGEQVEGSRVSWAEPDRIYEWPESQGGAVLVGGRGLIL